MWHGRKVRARVGDPLDASGLPSRVAPGARKTYLESKGSRGTGLGPGTGFRLEVPSVKGHLRIDAARGLVDGNSAVSVGWRIP